MKRLLSLAVVSALLMLSGCAHYKARPLKKLNTTYVPQSEKGEFLALNYKVFSVNDCNVYLDRNILMHGYQPLQIEITNHTARSFYISENSFNVSCAPLGMITKLVHTNTVGRAVGYGVTGLFIPIFLIPAIVDGIGSSEANKALDADYEHKALYDKTISKFSSVNGLIFIPKNEFTPHFTVTVASMETDEAFTLSPMNPYIKL